VSNSGGLARGGLGLQVREGWEDHVKGNGPVLLSYSGSRLPQAAADLCALFHTLKEGFSARVRGWFDSAPGYAADQG
jgi:hypothetical protein